MIFRVKVRDSYRRIRVAIARINSYLQEAVSGMLVLQLFNREKRAYRQFSDINASHMEAFKDAIMAYAVYYPVVEILSAIAAAALIWIRWRRRRPQPCHHRTRWSPSCSTRSVSSGRSRTSATSTTSCSRRWHRPSASSSCSIRPSISPLPPSRRSRKARAASSSITSGSPMAYVEPRPTRWPRATTPATTSDDGSSAGDPDWVLRDVSFALDPGETIAVVGHTGRGQDHAHLATAALLRRAAGRDPHRWRRHQARWT